MEKLIITMEVEDWEPNAHMVDFQVTIMEKGWMSRVFRNWRRVKYLRVPIKNLHVEKIP